MRAAVLLSLCLTLQMPAMAECVDVPAGGVPQRMVAPAAVAATAIVPVETVFDKNDVYSPINDKVVPRVEPLPEIACPVDYIKQQINNRVNSGIISGKLTEHEAFEVRSMLDDVQAQEAAFKLEAGCLTRAATANLLRKYGMVNIALTELLNNTDYEDYMPNFELRRNGIQRRIHYDLAAGNLTPEEAEQLLAALSTVSDLYATAQVTGDTVTANELEGLHRDLSEIQAKLAERVGGSLFFVSPPTNDKLAQLRLHIEQAIACKQVSPQQALALLKRYNSLAAVAQSISANEGVHAADLQMLARKIDDVDFMLTRQLRDRLDYGAPAPRLAGSGNKM